MSNYANKKMSNYRNYYVEALTRSAVLNSCDLKGIVSIDITVRLLIARDEHESRSI